ncbi:LAME_0F14224g1_1 [Lachancea meyersii CBS 8951]|uniref:Exosome complex protein n=1 Tax=Lachancea meyersii CBS 8951 TaxID=1266667 RepID=A0A1G4JXU3_9SACH|nr:LAME_0F14224g1_1 [Lachancea meyersii CBS 8951]
MDDSSKIKPYIAHLNSQLANLGPEINKFTHKSLDEQLLLLNDERSKLDLSNRYAYVLSSLIFAYMKLHNVKDLTPIKQELARVKRYMDLARQLDKNDEKQEKLEKESQEQAKQIINSALGGRASSPAISKVNFQGKHTKFSEEPQTGSASEKVIPKKPHSTGKVSKREKR